MRNVSELIGKPVISVDTGDKLGSVSDALIADGDVRLLALVIGGGVLGKEHVLPFRDVQTLGGDTILVRSQASVIEAREWRDSGAAATRSSTLRGRPVVTASGQRLGEISDFLIDDQTGAFDGLEVAASDFGGLRTKRSLLRPGGEIKIGPDAVIVPETAVASRETPGDPEGPLPD